MARLIPQAGKKRKGGNITGRTQKGEDHDEGKEGKKRITERGEKLLKED